MEGRKSGEIDLGNEFIEVGESLTGLDIEPAIDLGNELDLGEMELDENIFDLDSSLEDLQLKIEETELTLKVFEEYTTDEDISLDLGELFPFDVDKNIPVSEVIELLDKKKEFMISLERIISSPKSAGRIQTSTPNLAVLYEKGIDSECLLKFSSHVSGKLMRGELSDRPQTEVVGFMLDFYKDDFREAIQPPLEDGESYENISVTRVNTMYLNKMGALIDSYHHIVRNSQDMNSARLNKDNMVRNLKKKFPAYEAPEDVNVDKVYKVKKVYVLREEEKKELGVPEETRIRFTCGGCNGESYAEEQFYNINLYEFKLSSIDDLLELLVNFNFIKCTECGEYNCLPSSSIDKIKEAVREMKQQGQIDSMLKGVSSGIGSMYFKVDEMNDILDGEVLFEERHNIEVKVEIGGIDREFGEVYPEYKKKVNYYRLLRGIYSESGEIQNEDLARKVMMNFLLKTSSHINYNCFDLRTLNVLSKSMGFRTIEKEVNRIETIKVSRYNVLKLIDLTNKLISGEEVWNAKNKEIFEEHLGLLAINYSENFVHVKEELYLKLKELEVTLKSRLGIYRSIRNEFLSKPSRFKYLVLKTNDTGTKLDYYLSRKDEMLYKVFIALDYEEDCREEVNQFIKELINLSSISQSSVYVRDKLRSNKKVHDYVTKVVDNRRDTASSVRELMIRIKSVTGEEHEDIRSDFAALKTFELYLDKVKIYHNLYLGIMNVDKREDLTREDYDVLVSRDRYGERRPNFVSVAEKLGLLSIVDLVKKAREEGISIWKKLEGVAGSTGTITAVNEQELVEGFSFILDLEYVNSLPSNRMDYLMICVSERYFTGNDLKIMEYITGRDYKGIVSILDNGEIVEIDRNIDYEYFVRNTDTLNKMYFEGVKYNDVYRQVVKLEGGDEDDGVVEISSFTLEEILTVLNKGFLNRKSIQYLAKDDRDDYQNMLTLALYHFRTEMPEEYLKLYEKDMEDMGVLVVPGKIELGV